MTLESFIQKLPKAELHLHIEGSLEPELMFQLAQKNNIPLKYNSVEAIREAYQFSNLQDFLDIYYAGAEVLQTREDFYQLTLAYLKKCAEDNVVHTEIFFDPQTHTDRGIDFAIVVEGISQALEQGRSEMGISSHLILCFLRHLSEESALETLQLALPYKHLIKGVGLDSSEVGNPPEKFTLVFEKALQEGFVTVAHAGEEGDPSYIWGAINQLHVSRVDHGVRAIEDPELIKVLAHNQTPLTVCPLSNLKLKVFDELKDHNLKQLLDKGLRVTINSDDPAYFGGYVNQNYLETAQALNLSEQDLKALAKNSILASFMPQQHKDQYCQIIDQI